MFPEYIDNTILSSAKACMTQARYAYIEDLSSPGESVHLIFGGAFAYGLETARRRYHDDKWSPAESVAAGVTAARDMYGDFIPPLKSPKTLTAVGNAIRYYFTIWPLDSDPAQPVRLNDGSLGIEWRFKVPIPDLVHPDTGGPIYYVGRSDMIPSLQGMTIIEDDKTAGQLGEKWAGQWRLDSQFIGYIWAAGQEGILVPTHPNTALIRGLGVYTAKYNAPTATGPMEDRSILKKVTPEMVESGQAVYNIMQSFGHAQAEVTHDPWQVARWLHETKKLIGRLIHAYLNDPDGTRGEWDLALDKSMCGGFGGCEYTDLCSSPNPEIWKPVNFVKRKWNPLETI